MFCAYTRTRLQDVYMTIGPLVLVSPTDLGLNLRSIQIYNRALAGARYTRSRLYTFRIRVPMFL